MDYTIPELIERALDNGLTAEAHRQAYEKTWVGKRAASSAKALARSAHWWAAYKHDEMADNVWACIKYAA